MPDSGVPAAIGYGQQSGIPYELGIIRNHYVGRTFIEPEQRIRALGVKLKHNPTLCEVNGKRIVLIDDSIVRGTTVDKIVRMMYERGAREVHMRIACPPIAWPDYYGIDTPDRENLLAANNSARRDAPAMGCDSLGFLSVEGIYRVMGYDRRDPDPAAIHRPLLHRRLSDPPARSGRPAPCTPALAARRSKLIARILSDR